MHAKLTLIPAEVNDKSFGTMWSGTKIEATQHIDQGFFGVHITGCFNFALQH